MNYFIIAYIFFGLILLSNLFFAKRLSKRKKTDVKVSLLIPCRNEERNLKSLCTSLKSLTYKNKEIIFLDDNSTDNTKKIIKKYGFKVITGRKLPKGWMGKNWACHQLSEKAKGEYFLFIDADVQIKKDAIQKLLNFKGVISCFPKYKMKTFGELLTVPIIHWFALTFLSFPLAEIIREPSYSAANGQCILIKKDHYKKIGGHQRIRNSIVDDLSIARESKKEKIRVTPVISDGTITCRPYRSFKEGFDGFSKNMYSSMGNILVFLIFIAIMLGIFIYPITILDYIGIGFIIIHRIILSIIAKENILMFILHPIHMPLWTIIGFNSLIQHALKKRKWKERTY